jgi:PmbA protein
MKPMKSSTDQRAKELIDLCHRVVDLCKRAGAQDAAVDVSRLREVGIAWRDGNVEQITEATTRGMSMAVYVDGRYSVASTSDLRPAALGRFVEDTIALARTLTPDPYRALPDPALYADRPTVDLEREDPDYDKVTAAQRRELAKAIEDAVRAERGSDAILSVTSSVSDSWGESVKVTSNGFEGVRHGTGYWMGAEVSVKDADGRRPEDGSWAGGRFHKALPDPVSIGKEASRRAHGRLGAKKGESGVMPMAVENRAAGRLIGALIGPLSAGSLQQKRSFMEGKLGQKVVSEKLTLVDDPLIPRALGSRHFDGEGISAKKRDIIRDGVVAMYFVDTYYGKKLGMAPTTGGTSNIIVPGGQGDEASLLAAMGDGILVTGFLGGNTNSSTGDFSLGVQGFRVRGGKRAEAVSEMNIAGNLLELWQRLAAVGADPYPYASLLSPTLVFDGVQFAGT